MPRARKTGDRAVGAIRGIRVIVNLSGQVISIKSRLFPSPAPGFAAWNACVSAAVCLNAARTAVPRQHPRLKSLPRPPSIPEQRREPRIRIILTWGRRLRDRGDRSDRTRDRGIGAVEGFDETPLALRDCFVGRRPRSCSGQKKSICDLNRMCALRARCRISGPLLADPIDVPVPSVFALALPCAQAHSSRA